MPQTNENSRLECRFLSARQFTAIHKTFLEGFADYIIKFELSERQFQNHITLNAVDLNRSAGCFDADRPIGVSLNGFGDWEGKATVYDAGTTVIPKYRRRGASRAMFDWMIPMFADEGYKQFLLEVITQNDPAVRLYEQLGFRRTRELLLLEADPTVSLDRSSPAEVDIREIHRHEDIPFALFWDGKPSWQNSLDAIERSIQMKRLLGAFIGNGGFNIAFDNSLAEVNCAGRMSCLPLVVFAHVDQFYVLVSLHSLLSFADANLANTRLRFVNQVKKAFGMFHLHRPDLMV